MRHATYRIVKVRAPERFLIDRLAGRALDEIWAAQAHEARIFNHQDDVAQRRKIGSARDARTHHGGDLRHTELAPHK